MACRGRTPNELLSWERVLRKPIITIIWTLRRLLIACAARTIFCALFPAQTRLYTIFLCSIFCTARPVIFCATFSVHHLCKLYLYSVLYTLVHVQLYFAQHFLYNICCDVFLFISSCVAFPVLRLPVQYFLSIIQRTAFSIQRLLCSSLCTIFPLQCFCTAFP